MSQLFPLQINALYLQSPEQVIGQDIRFENIPWMNKEKDVFENPNTPLETNSIIPRPFSYDNSIYLEKGVHLHFVLPTHFKMFDEQGNLPAAPNRWYIKRVAKNSENIFIEEKEWIVESDYIWNVNDENLDKHSTCTYVEGEVGDDFKFNYVGRKYRVDEWIKREKHTNYLKNLTALGWGSMSFDVHYPNCRTVFGFHDIEGNSDCEYIIVGWVDKTEESIVAGRFTFEKSNQEFSQIKLDVSIANSLQETLIALLTEKNSEAISENDKIKIEEQIESILNFDKLNDQKLDWISRLRIERHDQQFHKVSGTTQYLVSITKNKTNSASDNESVDCETVEYNLDLSTISFKYPKELLNFNQELELNDAIKHQLELLPFEDVSNNKHHIKGHLFSIITENLKDDHKKFEPQESFQLLNKQLNEFELESFRLNTELESLYIHWSAFLNLLFVERSKNINKLKSDLQLLVSQITILKNRVKNLEEKLNKSSNSYKEELNSYYKSYLVYQIVNTLLNINPENINESEKKIIGWYHRVNDTHIILERKSKTDYYEPLPPSVIISCEESNEESKSIFNLYGDKYKNTIASIDKKISFNIENIWDENLNKDLFECNDIKTIITINEWCTYKTEWEASFLPTKEGHYLNNSGIFDENFICNSYNLDELNADIIKKSNIDSVSFLSNSNTYYGNSFVNNTIKDHILKSLAENKEKIESKVNKDIDKVIKETLEVLYRTNIIELSLTDFNNQLLQRSNALTILPLVPNGFSDHQNLAKEISDLLNTNKNSLNLLTSNNYSVFNPFRNGAFKLSRLRVVDSFGRFQIIEPNQIMTTQNQTIKSKPQWVELPPRYLQAASVDVDFQITETSKINSPVVGWIIPVYLTQKIEFFDANGMHLGSFDYSGVWESSHFEISIADNNNDFEKSTNNFHLKRIINWFKEKSPVKGFMSEFIKQIQVAMEYTTPEDINNPSLLETISTIPIAITLIDINLYTKGEALFDLKFNQNISINTYQSQRQYDRVKMPMTIGDMSQYNDGVLGYWHCNLDSFYKEREYDESVVANKLDSNIYFNNNEIKITERGEKYTLQKFLKENPIDGKMKWDSLQTIKSRNIESISYKNTDQYNYLRLNENRNSCQRYVLMHPKGTLNVKTGFLPVASVKIPFEQIKSALKKIELTLLTSPIITPKESLEISLSKDSRYRWSWVELHKSLKNEKLSVEKNIPIKKRTTQDLAIELKPGQYNRYKKFFEETGLLIYDENQNEEENIFYINEEKWLQFKNKEYKDEREQEIYKLLNNNIMSIPAFNLTRPTNSQMVLKEGWLSIKSTKI